MKFTNKVLVLDRIRVWAWVVSTLSGLGWMAPVMLHWSMPFTASLSAQTWWTWSRIRKFLMVRHGNHGEQAGYKIVRRSGSKCLILVVEFGMPWHICWKRQNAKELPHSFDSWRELWWLRHQEAIYLLDANDYALKRCLAVKNDSTNFMQSEICPEWLFVCL